MAVDKVHMIILCLVLWFNAVLIPKFADCQVNRLSKVNCSQPLGMESHRIPDSSLTASSHLTFFLRPSQGRLRLRSFFPWLPTGWLAAVTNKKQWFQIAFEVRTNVTGVATQGLGGGWTRHQWVTSYQVSSKEEPRKSWTFYKQSGKSRVFSGNRDANSVVYNELNPVIEAIYIRLHPQTWHRWIAMRVELFGCSASSTPVSDCFHPLGIEDKRIPDQSFSSSSRLTRAHSPWRARLHTQPGSFQPAGWAPRRNDRSPWLQVELKTPTVISGVGTQGGRYFWWSRGGWVTTYKLSFSRDGKLWKVYGQNTTEEEMSGNNNVNSVVINKLSPPIVSRWVRVHPIRQTTAFSYLRLELYGCKDVDECSSSPCQNSATCKDGVRSFTCVCLPGFTGKTCQIDIDECSSSPCQNGATCVDLVNGFRCSCSVGFTGIQCETVVTQTCRCGQRTTRRIVGGSRVLPGEWPWQAGLLIKNTTQIFCGGALISGEWIVTGAHCVTFRNASSLLVVLGEYDVTRKEGIEIYREVDGFYKHPQYDIVTADFDIALVRFTPALNRFNRFVSPVCLPTTNDSFPAGTNCTVTGYGRLAEGGRLATSLQQAIVPIVPRDTCQKAFPEFSITPRMMCAGYARGGIDACQGDSGGPLVCRKDRIHWFLGGIISWGLGCARPNSYGIYANVTVLATWVHSTLANYTICEP